MDIGWRYNSLQHCRSVDILTAPFGLALRGLDNVEICEKRTGHQLKTLQDDHSHLVASNLHVTESNRHRNKMS